MKDERTIRPGWIKSEPATDNVDNLRPNKDATWTVASEDSPAILITVTDKEAIPVGTVELTTDAQEITVFYTSAIDEPFKPITEKRSTEPKVGVLNTVLMASNFALSLHLAFFRAVCLVIVAPCHVQSFAC
jgi:hypothetical protein